MPDNSKQLDFLQERADLIEMIDKRSVEMGLDFSPIAPLLVRAGSESAIRGDVVAGVDLHTLRRIDAVLQELADRRPDDA